MTSDIEHRLNEYLLGSALAQPESRITDLESLTRGWECEMYAFQLEPAKGARQGRSSKFVLRAYPGVGAESKASSEFHNMRLLRRLGYPVPEVYLLELDTKHTGSPFMVMEWIEGQEMWSLLTSANKSRQGNILSTFAELFLRLHQINWRPFITDPQAIDHAGEFHLVDRWLERAAAMLEQFPGTGLEIVLEWLAERRELVPCAHPSITHNDFHPNNILVQADGAAYVVDWTGLSVSDFRFDLGWTLVLTHAYSGRSFRERVLAAYEECKGEGIDQLDFFLVSACARRLFDVSVSLNSGAERLGMRPGAAETMRQDLVPLSNVYLLLRDITGIRIEAVEDILGNIRVD